MEPIWGEGVLTRREREVLFPEGEGGAHRFPEDEVSAAGCLRIPEDLPRI